MTTRPSGDLTRTTLAVLFIFGMIAACFLVLQPFLASTVWAATLVLATWPVMLRLEAALGGRRGIAVSLMALVLLLLVMAPIAWAISAIVNNAVFLLSLPDAAASFTQSGGPGRAATNGSVSPIRATAISRAWCALTSSP